MIWLIPAAKSVSWAILMRTLNKICQAEYTVRSICITSPLGYTRHFSKAVPKGGLERYPHHLQMRIALIIERFAPTGGVERAAWQVAEGLADAGDQVHVFAREAVKNPKVNLHPLKVPTSWQPLRVSSFSREAGRAAPRTDFDAVQSFSRTRHQDIFRAGGGSHASYLEKSFQGLPLAIRWLLPRHRLLLKIEKEVFSDPSQIVICNSAMVAREVSERYGLSRDRCRLILNGVDLERFHPEKRDNARKQFRLSSQETVWLFLGHGFERKGLRTALEAFALSRDKDSSLWVAGRDSTAYWKGIANRLGVAKRVRFLGASKDSDKLLAAADGLLLPTKYDAFANVTLEAAASGCPVLTSRTNGGAGWLGEAGLSVDDPRDSNSFAEGLDALSDPKFREKLRKAGRKKAESTSWNHHITNLRTLYKEVSSRKREMGLI